MSEQSPEFNKLQGGDRENIDLSEQKSITGSAQSIGLEPSDAFVPPTMSLDAYEPQPDE